MKQMIFQKHQVQSQIECNNLLDSAQNSAQSPTTQQILKNNDYFQPNLIQESQINSRSQQINKYEQKQQKFTIKYYSFLSNILIAGFAQIDTQQTNTTTYPLFQMLDGIVKRFMLNELEIIFFLQTIEELKWNFDQPLILQCQKGFSINFLPNKNIQNFIGYKCLLLYLICCAFTVKCLFNDQQSKSLILIYDHVQSYCNFNIKQFLEKWKNENMSGQYKFHSRMANKKFNKLTHKQQDNTQTIGDYNKLVDEIIQISPCYINNNVSNKKIKNCTKQSSKKIKQLKKENQNLVELTQANILQ